MIIKISLIIAFFAFNGIAHSYSLSEYLEDVSKNNNTYQGAKLLEQGFEEQKDIFSLVYKPKFFVDASHTEDKRQTNSPVFQGNKTNLWSVNSGFSTLTKTGTAVKLYYSQTQISIDGVNPNFLPISSFFLNGWNFEVSQNLWKNGFGKQTLANQMLKSAQVKSNAYDNAFKQNEITMNAKKIFYELASLLDKINTQKQVLEVARSTSELINIKISKGLGEKADLYQMKSFVQTRKYELESSLVDLKKLTLDFNNLRGFGDEFPNDLTLPDFSYALNYDFNTLNIDLKRYDVRAKEEQMKVATNSYESSIHDNKPQLDVKIITSINGRASTYNQSMSYVNSGNYPYTVATLNFSIPLDYSAFKKINAGYKMAQKGAQLSYLQSLNDSKANLEKLKEQLNMGKELLNQLKSLVEINFKRVEEERFRYKIGKTTLYQLCLIEQEYLLSKINLINLHKTILQTIAEIETFIK
jgi:outer membrane protein TolC